MRLVHTGDWHLTEGPTFDSTLRCLRALVTSVEHAPPGAWLIGGDLAGTQVPHRQTIPERMALADIFQSMAQVAPVVICYGNHDYEHDLDVFGRLEAPCPIIVVDRPRILDLRSPEAWLRGRLYVLPYPTKRYYVAASGEGAIADQKAGVEHNLRLILSDWTADRRAHPELPAIMLAHLNIGGSRVAGGEVLIGEEIELSPLDLEATGMDYVALSHIHLYQQIAGNAWYAGSPDRSNFGESDEKGFLYVEINEHEQRSLGVTRCLTPARRLITVSVQLGELGEIVADDVPSHIELLGAEVKLRIIHPEHVDPAIALAKLEATVTADGARIIKTERRILPVTRLRSEAILTAHSTADKLAAYWATLIPPPSVEQQTRCLQRLAALG